MTAEIKWLSGLVESALAILKRPTQNQPTTTFSICSVTASNPVICSAMQQLGEALAAALFDAESASETPAKSLVTNDLMWVTAPFSPKSRNVSRSRDNSRTMQSQTPWTQVL